jgi:hypothetical protein
MKSAGICEFFLNGIPPSAYKAFVSPYLKAKRVSSVMIYGSERSCSICELLRADNISCIYYDKYYTFRGFRNIVFFLSALCGCFPVLLVSMTSPRLFYRLISRFNQQLLFAINDELRKAESIRNHHFSLISFKFYSFLLYLRFVAIYASLKLYMDDSPGLVLISGHRCYRSILPFLAFGFRSSIYFDFGWPMFQSSPYSKNFKCFPGLNVNF